MTNRKLAQIRKLGCLMTAIFFLSACSTYRDCRSENIPKGQCIFVTVFENIQP